MSIRHNAPNSYVRTQVAHYGRWLISSLFIATIFAQVTTATGCGEGVIYAGDSVTFGHPVSFTINVNDNAGYLTDCLVHADAYLALLSSGGGSYTYAVWGQLGSYS